MRTSRPTILMLALLLSLALAVSAASKGSETKGKYYFKQTCKSCHTKGAAGGEITPLNKKMTQWTAYFQAGKHAHGKEPASTKERAAPAEHKHQQHTHK